MSVARILISFEVEFDSLDTMTDEEVLEHVQGDTDLYGKVADSSTSWSVERPFLAAVQGILDGYFEFVSMYRYWSERTMIVRLTEKGYEFFRTLPRLELECA